MEPVLDLALRTFRPFATRHGYDLIIGDGRSGGRPPSWGKILLLRRLLNVYETVLWIDSDAIILDDSVDPVTLMPDDAFQALVIHNMKYGQQSPNTGVWLLRGGPGKKFLDAIWREEQFIDHPHWENAAACELLGFSPGPSEYVQVADSQWMKGTHVLDEEWNQHNLIVSPRPCRIRHYAGRSNLFRRKRMLIDLAEISGRPLEGKLRRVEWRLRSSRLATAKTVEDVVR
jgi:hypothetical protein